MSRPRYIECLPHRWNNRPPVITGMQDAKLVASPSSKAWNMLAAADKRLQRVQGELVVDVAALYAYAIEVRDLDAFALASVGYRVLQRRNEPMGLEESA